MDKPRETIVAWLRDAYAMENSAISLLKKQIDRDETYPHLLPRLKQHLEESQWQAEQIRGCLEKYDTDPSTLKNLIGKVMASMGAIESAMSGDEVVKNCLGNYAFECFEIACYKALIQAAEDVGDVHTQRVCEIILDQEIAMAKWVELQLPDVVTEYMAGLGNSAPGSYSRVVRADEFRA
jgi:ferritin-like metal-binding protein YciE